MITDFLISVVYNVILLIVNIISLAPDVALSVSLTSAITNISPYYQALNVIIPMATFTAILSFELIFITFYFTYKLIRWAYVKIPFLN